MIVERGLAHSPLAYTVSTDGEHSFATDVPGERALIAAPLTGRQILFLADHPAAVRCCLTRGAISVAWLDQLIAAVETPPPTTGARH